MNSNDWKNIIATVAPGLATALGGPLAGMAVSAIAAKVLGNPAATPDDVAKAVLGASPDVLLKLKQAELEFQKSLNDAGIKLEEVAAADRASAREREIAVKDHTPAILAYFVTAGFFGVLGYLLVYGKPAEGGDALLVMLGSLGTAWAAVISYFYGSSVGSEKKNATIANLANK